MVVVGHLLGIGATTNYSCQDDGGQAYLYFADVTAYECGVMALAGMCQLSGDAEMVPRILATSTAQGGENGAWLPGPLPPMWEIILAWTWEVDGAKLASPCTEVIVRFPPEDRARLESSLRVACGACLIGTPPGTGRATPARRRGGTTACRWAGGGRAGLHPSSTIGRRSSA